MSAERRRELILSIRPNKANFDNIATSPNQQVNGSLMVDIDRIMEQYANEQSESAVSAYMYLTAYSNPCFVNIYEDDLGARFISNSEYDTWEAAYSERDQLSTYVETVEIVRR